MPKENNKDSSVKYKNPVEYERYIKKYFACMKADEYQVKVSERLYYRATRDKKIEQWLENNLIVLPFCMQNLKDMIAVTGGVIVSCICYMNNYNNISTEIHAADRFSESGLLCNKMTSRSIIRTTNVREIEKQVRYNSIFWTPEAESAGFEAKA